MEILNKYLQPIITQYFIDNKEPILLCSFANAQKTDINNRK